ncbi:MAG: sulfite reductase [Acidobacteria bacterium]|nr:MAG: sulfite reductase [Acidobacteriota bacterium]
MPTKYLRSPNRDHQSPSTSALDAASLDRRAFVKLVGTAAIGWGVSPVHLRAAWAQRPIDPSRLIPGKDRRLIVHNSKTGVLETPVELLRQHRVTPKETLFVRNNQFLPGSLTLDPLPLDNWTIEIMGLVKAPRIISATELAQMEQTDVEMVLQCSGNGRSYYARTVKTRGTQWKKGGMGNVRWRGVLLKTVFERAEVTIHPSARFLTAEGKDAPLVPTAPDFEHSVPLHDVIDKAILALEMNGEPIPAVHGGPVRLIIPGYYGTMNIKWLHRLRLEAHETFNHHQIPRYRTYIRPVKPGTRLKRTFENTAPNWHQRVKSIIWSPLEDDVVAAGPVTISGVAWNDGMVEIEAVYVSTDRGRTWQRARLQVPASRYAWYPWTITVPLRPGQHEIWSRAIDALGRSQPLDGSIHWNPSGYEWYGVDKIRITVS